ncbi:LysR family transcriptional regulator [Aureimonas sp. D3]|uniref:LysR family transcriptional regulator n=1 Tax=Aureimonas sp. D3 TaxID=1638164 RepID=UPI001FCCF2A9|nr:LysR family transcriptional regulator [Aureimonas sp. D3]
MRNLESEACRIATMFDWQDMRYFLAAAKAGSLTKAAIELGVDHATVGRRVARLEAAIGVKLLHRLPRSTQLTEQGGALVNAAAAMEESAEATVRHLRGQVNGLSGQVTVSALPALAAFIIAPDLPVLLGAHPGLRLILSATSTVTSLERGEADIAIGFVRPAMAGRIVRRVGHLRFGLYGAPVLAARASEDWQFIGFEESLGGIVQQQWLDGFVTGRPFVLRTNDVTTQVQAARAGLGAALLPSILGDAEKELIRLDAAPPSRPLWMSVHADVRRSPVVRAVMDHLVRTFAE